MPSVRTEWLEIHQFDQAAVGIRNAGQGIRRRLETVPWQPRTEGGKGVISL